MFTAPDQARVLVPRPVIILQQAFRRTLQIIELATIRSLEEYPDGAEDDDNAEWNE
jgi:hypothetical protein